jgi:hypothetical protein
MFIKRTSGAAASGLVSLALWAGLVLPLLATGCGGSLTSETTLAGDLVDEAQANHKTEADFPEEDSDIWKYMDGDTPDTPGRFKMLGLTTDEIKGRNTWLMWCAGNEAFWDYFANHSYGFCDLLKVLDTRDRGRRFAKYGLLSEPGFARADKPDQYGIWLDVRTDPPEASRPGVYGLPSGIVGLRLFPNPAFENSAAARRAWDADRYYNDPGYYGDPSLVRPYRVGMSCAFCHVGLHPLYPPQDPENPKWENMSSFIGPQYFKVRPTFAPLLKPDDYIYQLLEASLPGTLDTSLLPTDSINNPNTMNAVFSVGPRLARSLRTPAEIMAEPARSMTTDSADLGLPPDGPDGSRHVPHILLDGSDSIGISGALNRVYINIGTFHQYWLTTQNLVVGGRPQKPMELAFLRKNSVYWRVTERRSINVAKFFLKGAKPMRLKDAPGGAAYLTADKATLDRGKIAFAENCMCCHSSKQPDDGVRRDPENHDEWARSDSYLKWAREAVMKDDFLVDNYLSVDQRYGVDRIGTNANRAVATNATRGHVWDNFSSETYKNAPSAGTIKVYDPVTGGERDFKLPAGGPGYYRVPTLIGLWATAPYLHNNSCGTFNGDPSVKGRMAAFDDGIRKLFWPERRDNLKSIFRTDRPCYLKINSNYFPDLVEGVTGRRWITLTYPWLVPLLTAVVGIALASWGVFAGKAAVKIAGGVLTGLAAAGFLVAVFLLWGHEDLMIGPIPKGTPVNLISNLDVNANRADLFDAVLKLQAVLARIEVERLDDDRAAELFNKEAAPALLKVATCPDLVLDRGHRFAERLPDADKEALIAFLKTF